ncbi:aldehyde dehydrogenase family protein, partial [Caballeronia mineralivorans]
MSDSTLRRYPSTQLYIDGAWRAGSRDTAVVNPATEAEIGRLALAGEQQLAEAAEAAGRGFAAWRKVSAFDRSKLMRR